MPGEPDDEQSPVSESGRAPSARVLALRTELLHLRHDLQALLYQLDSVNEAVPHVQSAVVTAVVPKTVLMHHGPLRRE
jgi:hypothetical protein